MGKTLCMDVCMYQVFIQVLATQEKASQMYIYI